MSDQQKSKKPSEHEDSYKELHNVVKSSLSSKIDKKRIEKTIQTIVDAFVKESYNPLLLYFYSFSKENYLISHIANNVILAVGFGASLNLSKENLIDLGLCAFCHDFGMKEYTHFFQKDQRFSEYESRVIQDHPLKSAEIFKDVFSKDVIEAIEDVHEKVNGQGYPKGKLEPEISFLAKMVSICDVYEALTHQRNSRKRVVPYEAIKLIIKEKDKVFDGKVVKRFVDFMSIYPIGSLIYLNTGEIGMVVGSNYGYPTRCIVRVLLTAKQEIDQSQKVFDLLQDTMVYVSSAVSLDEENEILKVLAPRGNFDL